jgi:hypothetical protein
MVPDDTRVRRRGSPTRREFDMAVKQCDEVKEHCRNKNRVVRMFFLAPPVLLLVCLYWSFHCAFVFNMALTVIPSFITVDWCLGGKETSGTQSWRRRLGPSSRAVSGTTTVRS